MAKIIYLEETMTLIANTDKFGLSRIKEISESGGELKQTENGYRYIVIEDKIENNETN